MSKINSYGEPYEALLLESMLRKAGHEILIFLTNSLDTGSQTLPEGDNFSLGQIIFMGVFQHIITFFMLKLISSHEINALEFWF